MAMTRNRELHPQREGSSLEDLRACVNRVAPTGSLPPFQRPEWFALLARRCFPDARLHIANATDRDASVWMPLLLDRNGLSALSNWYSFSFAPLFLGTHDNDQQADLLATLAGSLRGIHHRISLYPVVGDTSATAAMIARAFKKAGWITIARPQGVNYCLDVADRSFENYWASRPGALRKQVRRKGSKSAYRFDIHYGLTDVLWDDYSAIYAASWKDAEPFPDMIRDMARDAGLRGALRLGFARDQGRPVAVQFWTVEGGTAYIHKIAHDRSLDASSPGTLLSHHMFRHVIDDDRVAHIDYGTGSNSSKRAWMEGERPMIRIDCYDPRVPAAWLPAARASISALVGGSARL